MFGVSTSILQLSEDLFSRLLEGLSELFFGCFCFRDAPLCVGMLSLHWQWVWDHCQAEKWGCQSESSTCYCMWIKIWFSSLISSFNSNTHPAKWNQSKYSVTANVSESVSTEESRQWLKADGAEPSTFDSRVLFVITFLVFTSLSLFHLPLVCVRSSAWDKQEHFRHLHLDILKPDLSLITFDPKFSVRESEEQKPAPPASGYFATLTGKQTSFFIE